MDAIKLDDRLLDGFKSFCAAARGGIDGSFLTDEDLRGFLPGALEPAYLLIGSSRRIDGAASLMFDENTRKTRRARFRILHCRKCSQSHYQMLLEAILKSLHGVDQVCLFAPLENPRLQKVLDWLGFTVERNVYSLIRASHSVAGFDCPISCNIEPFVVGVDENAWCEARNAAFASLKGNEDPISCEQVFSMASSPDSIEGGMLVLRESGRVVAVARGALDTLDGRPAMNIGPLAVIPERQGKGYGRLLLRHLVRLAFEKGLDSVTLSVNADNETALKLYVSEGFAKSRCFSCRVLSVSAFLEADPCYHATAY